MRDTAAWHTKTLVTDGQDIFAWYGPSETYSTVRRPGQRVFEIFLGDVAKELDRAGNVLGFGKWLDVSPEVRGGAPVVRNTRLPTKLIGDLVREGVTPRELQAMYPGLTSRQIRAADELERQLEAV